MSVRQENRFRAQSSARFRQAGTLAGQIEALRREQRIIAAQILERHHQASAREIASLLLDAAGVEVGP